MTAMVDRVHRADRPQMLVEEFEDLVRHADKRVRLEFIYGKLGAKPMPDGDHLEIIAWLQKQFILLTSGLWLYASNEIKVEAYRGGRAIPDATLAPDGTFVGQPLWKNPDGILMAVEVTSFDSDTDRRDRTQKPHAYAETGIPVYLLVDRSSCETVVYSRPVDGRYSTIVRLPFGTPVELPEPVGVTLETDRLKDLVR
jgi:Uma2 family endonuclease